MFFSKTPKNLPDMWLMVRLSHIGDVVLTTGVMRYLYNNYGYSFDILTRKNLSCIFEHNPAVKNIHSLTDSELHLPALYHRFYGLANSYDSPTGLLDLHGTLRSKLLQLLWKSGPVIQYNKFSKERRLFALSKGKYYKKRLLQYSVPERYALSLEKNLPPRIELEPQIFLTQQETEAAEKALYQLSGSVRMRPVALHPFAAHETKTWPVNHWLQLIAFFEANAIPFIIIGQDSKGTEHPLAHFATSFINTLSLRESTALLSRCSALITGDSGPMHLARAVNTPVIALFGPTTREWGFYPSREQDTVFETTLPCRPCSLHGNTSCPIHGACLNAIRPDLVGQAAKKLFLTQNTDFTSA